MVALVARPVGSAEPVQCVTDIRPENENCERKAPWNKRICKVAMRGSDGDIWASMSFVLPGQVVQARVVVARALSLAVTGSQIKSTELGMSNCRSDESEERMSTGTKVKTGVYMIACTFCFAIRFY